MLTAVLLFSLITTLTAQDNELKLNPAVQFFPEENQIISGDIHIIAAMVDFQRVDNPYTSGDGSFHLPFLDRDDIIIDPLPHNKPYFEAHLSFVKNYFERVSNNQIRISFEVLPQVYTLDNEMAAYAPLGEDGSENFKLANLARDSWQKVTESSDLNLTGRDMDKTMFIVFHAGAGRDIELIGTTLHKTPQDIPSVFLGTSSLERLLDMPDFVGFPTNREDFFIRNTAILPQTESRAGEDFLGNEIVLQLSINGMLTATVGSFLGLPDLFNTATGQSGIGRFGLMDGASIFSYLGKFPPEPSAWEKVYMGWATPFDIDLDSDEPIHLPAVSEQRNNQIARLHISRDEYFLIENRHRDADGNGVTLTLKQPDGTRAFMTIESSDERFNPFNSSQYNEIMVPGVVIDVTNFDFSLPGGAIGVAADDPDEDDSRVLTGGMLIWHIDEAVIRSKMDANRINANPERRGVRLVEADGAQQIGKPEFGLETGRYVNGHAFDFWWAGNDFTVVTTQNRELRIYQNRFGPDTQPNNRSNTGSTSYFEFYNFSENLPDASFFARRVNPDFASPHQLSGTFAGDYSFFNSSDNLRYPFGIQTFITAQNDTILIFPSQDGIISLNLNDENAQPDFTEMQLRSVPLSGDLFWTPLAENGTHSIAAFDWINQSLETVWQTEIPQPPSGFLSITAGDTLESDHSIYRFSKNDGSRFDDRLNPIQRSAPGSVRSAITGSELRVIRNGESFTPAISGLSETTRKYAGLLYNGRFTGAFALTENQLYAIDFEHEQLNTEMVWEQSALLNWPALADWTHDGLIDFLLVDQQENQLIAVNQRGAMLNNFPIYPPQGKTFSGTPLIADITGDGNQEIIITAQDSLSITILAYNRQGRVLNGFPLYVGSAPGGDNFPIHPIISGNKLIAISANGDIRIWTFPDMGTVSWASQYGDFINGKVSSVAGSSNPSERTFTLLNSRETYNWPNPATDQTYIRFETRQPAEIKITVVDMAGTKLRDYTLDSYGNQPQEFSMNLNGLGSGVYFARVQARAGGITESELIKIVVIR